MLGQGQVGVCCCDVQLYYPGAILEGTEAVAPRGLSSQAHRPLYSRPGGLSGGAHVFLGDWLRLTTDF